MRVSIFTAFAALWLGQANATTVNLSYQSGPLGVAKSCVTDLLSSCEPWAEASGVPIQHLSYTLEFSFDDADASFVDGHARFDIFDGTLSMGPLTVFSEDGASPVQLRGPGDAGVLSLLDFWVEVDTAFKLTDLFLRTELEADPAGAELPGVWAALYVDHYPGNAGPSAFTGPAVSLWFTDPAGTDHGAFGLYRTDSPAPVPLPATAPLLALALAGGVALRRRAS